MKVRDLLTKKPSGVITISPDKPLRAASKVLAQHNIGVLVAVDVAGLPVGILSERDIVRAIAATGAKALTHTHHRSVPNFLVNLVAGLIAY